MTKAKVGQAGKGRPSNYSNAQLKEMALRLKTNSKGKN